jgi:hypothetical protein
MTEHVHVSLSAYMDGELPPQEQSAVEAHLKACPECAQHLEQLSQTDLACRELPVEAPEGYFETFPGRIRSRLTPQKTFRLPAWSWAAVAALLFMAVTPLLWRRLGSEGEERVPTPTSPARDAPQPAGAPRPALAPEPPAEAVGSPGRPSPFAAQTAPPRRAAAAPAPALKAPGSAGSGDAQAPQREEPQRAADETASVGYVSPPSAGQEAGASPEESKERAKSEAGRAEGGARQGKAMAAPMMANAEKRASPDRFQALAARKPTTAGEARDLREEWRSLVGEIPAGPRADDARFELVLAGKAALDLSGDPSDRETLRRDLLAYLGSGMKRHADEVRTILGSLSP